MENNGKAIHFDRLENSNPAIVQTVADVFHRLQDLEGTHIRVRGVSPEFPPELTSAVQKYLNMLERFNSGDYRHRKSEIKAMEHVMRWAYEENCALRNQKIDKIDN